MSQLYIQSFNLPHQPLQGEIAIITGAGRGIGKELARALAYLGATVIIAEISDTGKNVEKLINNEGGKAEFIQTDVSSEKSMQNMAKKVLSKYHKVDILINNAIIITLGTTLEFSTNQWLKTLNVNVMGAIFGIQLFLPLMLQKKHGIIASCVSAEGMPFASPYFASKCALGSLTKSLAIEIGDDKGVSIFCFGPGMVDTPGFAEALRYIPKKLGIPEKEFLQINVNPGYEGLMPADHCATGFALAILNAQKLHGEITAPFPFIEEYKQQTSQIQESYSPEKISEFQKGFTPLLDVLLAIQVDFQKINRMFRSFALREFEKQVGVKLNDLISDAQQILDLLNKNELKKSINQEQWNQRSNQLLLYLDNTIVYLKKFIKNPDDYNQAKIELENRKFKIQNFTQAIK